MKKQYVQPEFEAIMLVSLNDFLEGSPDLENSTDDSWGNPDVPGDEF